MNRNCCLLSPFPFIQPLVSSSSLRFVHFPHAQRNVTVDMFESLSSSAFPFELFVVLISINRPFFVTTRSRPFASAFDPHITTAHSR